MKKGLIISRQAAITSLFISAIGAAANPALAQDSARLSASTNRQTPNETAQGRPILDETIYVDGIYNAQRKVLDIPAAITVIGEGDISRIKAVHPAEVLNRAAGLNIHRGSGQEHLTALRSPVLTGGAGAGSFLYLEDGVPLRAAGFSNVNGLFEAGSEFAGKFEVFKGPGPAEYGSNAVHGLINIQSRAVGADDYSRVLVSDQGYASVITSQSIGPIKASVSLAHDSGFRSDSGFDQQKLALKYENTFGPWSVEGLSSFSNLNQETAGFVQGSDAYKDTELSEANAFPEAFRDGKSYRVQARLERDINGKTLAFTPYARRAELRFLRHFVPGQALEKNAHSSAGLQSAYYDDDVTLGLDLEYSRGSLFEFQDEPTSFSFAQGLHFDYSVRALTAAAYAQKQIALGGDIHLSLGARADYTHYDYTNNADVGQNGRFIRAADRADDFFILTPKLSLSRRFKNSQLYARAARGARAPQVTDLYSVQLNQTVGAATTETLDSLEAGYKFDGETFQAEAAVYTMRKDGFFFRNANGFNVVNGKTRHEGVELSARYQPRRWISFTGNASLARHRYAFSLDEGSAANTITRGARVDSAPDSLGSARLTLTPPQTVFGTQVLGEIEWRHVGAYFTNPGNTARYDGHDIFVARAEIDLSDALRLSLRADNLFDQRYADRADFAFGNERYFPGRPRTIFVGLSAGF